MKYVLLYLKNFIILGIAKKLIQLHHHQIHYEYIMFTEIIISFHENTFHIN